MIDEHALHYKRGELVEFLMSLGAGQVTCTGLILNTAVLFGKSARQVWIVGMEGASEEARKHWLNRKHLVPESDFRSRIASVLIGSETLLRENPLSYPVRDHQGEREQEVLLISVPIPASVVKVGPANQSPPDDEGAATEGTPN